MPAFRDPELEPEEDPFKDGPPKLTLDDVLRALDPRDPVRSMVVYVDGKIRAGYQFTDEALRFTHDIPDGVTFTSGSLGSKRRLR